MVYKVRLMAYLATRMPSADIPRPVKKLVISDVWWPW